MNKCGKCFENLKILKEKRKKWLKEKKRKGK